MFNQPPRKRQRSQVHNQDAAQSESNEEGTEDQDSQEEDSQEDLTVKNSTTTRGGPAASSAQHMLQYRGLLASALTLISTKANRLIPQFLEIELKGMGFEVDRGIVNVPLSEYALIEKEDDSRKLLARMDKADRLLTPSSSEKEWVRWFGKTVDRLDLDFELSVVENRRWDPRCIPFARDQTPGFPQKLSPPQPDIQYYLAGVELAAIMDTVATVEQRPALEACKSSLELFSTDPWRNIVGTLGEPVADPYVNIGIRPVLLPFFYVQFKADDRYDIAYNELATDLLHALYKLRKLRGYLQQLGPEQADDLKLESRGRSVFGMIATPQIWKLYVAWDQDGDFKIMPIAGNTLPDGLGRLHWVACIKKVFKWAHDGNGWQMANWLLHVKQQDLAEKACLGRGEKWSLADLKRRTLPEPDHCTRSINQWAATTLTKGTSAETEVEEIERVSRLL